MNCGKKQWSSPYVLVILLILFRFSDPASTSYSTWEDVTNKRFNHIIVDDSTGTVYIGAVNRIYQLTGDLNLEATTVMGPQDDSPNYPPTKACSNDSKKSTDYYNKALLIDPSTRKLIACGSLFQGLCTVHDPNNVTKYDTSSNEAVVANNDVASTVAFTAPGPDLDRTHVLYVGVSYTNDGPYRADVPAVSSRSLDPSNMFTLSTIHTRMYVNSMSREIYPITYVSGFSSNGFSYFLTVQKQSTSPSSPFISKLVRVCHNDPDYYSYTEVPLVCKTRDGTDYNLVQAAYVGRPGSELAKSLGISKHDTMLFALFSKSKDETGIHGEPSQNSALCVYSLIAIRRKFKQNIQHCFNGNGDRGLDFINPNRQCLRTQLKIDEDFCGLDVNTPLGGTMPVQAAPVLRYPGILLTAIAVTSTSDFTVAFLGTSTGHLKKVVLETATIAAEYGDIVIQEGSPVNADMLFDKTENFIYVMTENRVTKVRVQDCDVFHTCTDCIGVHDPYCGWCSFENKCLPRKACSESEHDSLSWLSHKMSRCFIASDEDEETKPAEAETQHPGHQTNDEATKLQALQDIAHHMRSIDFSLKELVALQKKNR